MRIIRKRERLKGVHSHVFIGNDDKNQATYERTLRTLLYARHSVKQFKFNN